jgi:hypothetical protein
MRWLFNRFDRPIGTGDGSWTSWPRAVLLAAGFAVLYVSTRSSIWIGDGLAFMTSARGGDPADFFYGSPNHFLQGISARAIWLGGQALGLPVPLEGIWLAISLVGTLAAIVSVGFLAAELLRSPIAGSLAAVLFGTSLHSWTQWNGEQYGPAITFVSVGLLLALRRRVAAPAGLWALAVLAHAEFFLAAPAFVVAVWTSHPSAESTKVRLRGAIQLLALAGVLTATGLLIGTRVIGKWHDVASLVEWLQYVHSVDHAFTVGGPEVARATKGLVTAFTVAGHFTRDILTGRGAFSHPGFLPASLVGFAVLGFTGICVAMAFVQRRLFVFAVAWLLPHEMLGNWWFVPTVEKYHAGALPGFVLLVTGGLFFLSSKLPARRATALRTGFVLTCAALNLFGAVLPMQALGRDTEQATRQVRRLDAGYGGRVVLVTCDGGNVPAVVDAEVEYLRVRSIWKGSVAEIQDAILSWTRARVAEGKVPHVLDRWCYPEEWGTSWSKKPFDQFFLGGQYHLTPTSVTSVPLAQPSTTDPFTWRRGDIVRLDPAGGPQ